MIKKGWIAVRFFDYEGMDIDEPARVYWTKKAAEQKRKSTTLGLQSMARQ